jgi:hypothetical protein
MDTLDTGTKGVTGKKIEKSRTNLTIFDILKKTALSKVTICRHIGLCDFFRICHFCLFSCVNLHFFLAVGYYVPLFTVSLFVNLIITIFSSLPVPLRISLLWFLVIVVVEAATLPLRHYHCQ